MKVAKLGACVIAAAIAVGAAPTRAEDNVLRVGIITDMSGQYKDGNGPGSVIAAQMAAEEIGRASCRERVSFLV